MKYFGIFYVIVIVCTSCANGNWSNEEQDKFLSICFDEGGTKDYCYCFLDKMMEFSPIADEVDQIDYEQKVELAKDCE